MELYFLRHAIAAPRGLKYPNDSLRPLTSQGRRKMQRSARGIKALGLMFDAVLSSPYLRAKQTAEIVAKICKPKNKEIHFTKTLLPPAPIKELLQEIVAHFPKARHVLLVGHEPHLTQLISSYLKSGKRLDMDFKKGGLCHVSVLQKPQIATLNWLITPKQLGLIAK
jgi:phosphohistidine phosphatase